MGYFQADCMSSLEQIRQQAAGSLVKEHAPFYHRRNEWEESSITTFVKALSQGDEQLMTALGKMGMELLGIFETLSEAQTEIWGLDTIFNSINNLIEKIAKCKVFSREQLNWGKQVWWGSSFRGTFSVTAVSLFINTRALHSGWVVFLWLLTVQGPGEGKGNRRFMSFCDTRCSGSHVNGKWDAEKSGKEIELSLNPLLASHRNNIITVDWNENVINDSKLLHVSLTSFPLHLSNILPFEV